MPPKRTKNVVQFEKPFVFPTQEQIEANLQRRLKFWEDPERNAPYHLPVLDFLVNAIGCELQNGEDDPEFGKDAEFYNPHWYTTGITNGELFYSLYKTILLMTQDETFDFSQLPQCDQQAFFSMLDLAITLFLDRREEPGFGDDRIDLWILYSWTRKKCGFDVWQTEDGKATKPPPLQEFSAEDWDSIAEDVKMHFSEDGDDEYLEIALLDEQLHWPTFQEFRSAKAHILNWYGRTRVNTESKS